MISAFGSQAQVYCAGLTDFDAIVTEPEYLLNAYVEAVRRRARGEAYYGMLLLDDARDRAMSMLAAAVLHDASDLDYARSALKGIGEGTATVNGKPSRDWLAVGDIEDSVLRAAASEFLLLCPAVLVRSPADYERVSALSKRPRAYELIVMEPALPVIERRPGQRSSIVVWAPERVASSLALHAFALSEIPGDVSLLSADGVVPVGSNAAAYRCGDPRVHEILAAAVCIVVTHATDPGAAVAFARLGYGVAAARSSGAHHFVHNVQTYDPTNPREVHVAAMMALGQPASPRALQSLPPPRPARPSLPDTVPSATIVIPTFNRRDDLARCLRCIADQTYPNMRAVVVNDAGEKIDDVVAPFPFARLLDLEANVGVTKACMNGLELVDDGFVLFLSDDDVLYPDHIEWLAGAMLRSGAAYAHANTLVRYVERTDGGAFATTGFNLVTFVDTATPSEALIATPITGQSILWRRSVFSEIGGWLSDSMLSDQEIQMRAGQRYALAYVDQVLAEWRVHGDNFSGKVNSIDEQRRIYEVVHPRPDRPFLTKIRNKALEHMAKRPLGYVFEPSVVLKQH